MTVRRRRRAVALLTRRQIATAARITEADLVRARATWYRDAPPVWRRLLDARVRP